MQIVRNDEAATWTFFPANPTEEEVIRGIAALEPKTKLSQLGSKSDEDGRRRINYFGYHGKFVPKVEKERKRYLSFDSLRRRREVYPRGNVCRRQAARGKYPRCQLLRFERLDFPRNVRS